MTAFSILLDAWRSVLMSHNLRKEAKYKIAWLLYGATYPLGLFLDALGANSPEPASSGAGYGLLLGTVLAGALSCYLCPLAIKRYTGLRRIVMVGLPFVIVAVYFYVWGFTPLGDQLADMIEHYGREWF